MKKHTMLSEIWRRFKKNKQAVVGLIVLIIFILVAIFAKQIAPYWYDDQDASRAMIGPCAQYPFGTDNLGRDVLSRLIYGSRYSLSIGFLAVGISVLTGGFLGVIAAYYPKLDNIIMRCMDLFMAIPQMLLAMCIVTALGSSLFNLMLAVVCLLRQNSRAWCGQQLCQHGNRSLSRRPEPSAPITGVSLSTTFFPILFPL